MSSHSARNPLTTSLGATGQQILQRFTATVSRLFRARNQLLHARTPADTHPYTSDTHPYTSDAHPYTSDTHPYTSDTHPYTSDPALHAHTYTSTPAHLAPHDIPHAFPKLSLGPVRASGHAL
jgi:hypothetical protein